MNVRAVTASSTRTRGFALAALGLALAASQIVLGGGCGNTAGKLSASKQGDMSLGPSPRGPFDEAVTAACGAGDLTDEGDKLIIRLPYLQKVTPHSAKLMWTTTGDAPFTVSVATPDGLAVAALEPETETTRFLAGRQLVTRLEGLEPSTTYCYTIHSGDERLIGPIGFTTAPPAGSEGPVRFIAIGDMGTASSDQFAVLSQMEGVQFDFIVATGDIAYDDGKLRELERHFFEVYQNIIRSFPFFVASGNHDMRTADGGPFREVFALFENGGPAGLERWYSFDWGPIHFAVLDTEAIGAEQAEWLDRDLAATRQPWKVVVAHRPPYASGKHGSHLPTRQVFTPLFEKHGVQLVLLGHEHAYERTKELGGVTYLVTGGGGRGTRPIGTSSFTAFSEEVGHFVYAVADANELRLWAIDGTGQDFDTLKLTR